MKKLIFLFAGCLLVQGSMHAMDNDNMFAAARRGDADAVEAFLLSGAPVDDVDSHNETALMRAALGDHAPVIKLLIAWGANVNHLSQSGPWQDCPLSRAICAGTLQSVKALVAAGADLNLKCNGKTQLEVARQWLSSMAGELEFQRQEQSIIDFINNVTERINAAPVVARNQLFTLLCAGHSRCGAASPARDVFHSYGNVANIMAQLIKKEAFEAALDSQNQ